MSNTNNVNIPSAVGTNRTYGQVVLENLRNGWDAIKSNAYINMFLPVEDAANGNTLAVVTAAVPGKQAVTTAGKAILGHVEEAAKQAEKVIRPGANKVGEILENGIEYTVHGSSQPGTPLYFHIPKSEITRGKPKWIPTLEEVAEALAKHTTSAKKTVSDGVRRAADWTATQEQHLRMADRRSMNKVTSETTRLNNTVTRQGVSQDKSVLPKVTTYLKETLASGFTPSKKARIKGDVDLAYQEWLEYLRKLQYDTKSKDSVKALNQIAEETWMKLFQPKKKQGGILNYITYFS